MKALSIIAVFGMLAIFMGSTMVAAVPVTDARSAQIMERLPQSLEEAKILVKEGRSHAKTSILWTTGKKGIAVIKYKNGYFWGFGKVKGQSVEYFWGMYGANQWAAYYGGTGIDHFVMGEYKYFPKYHKSAWTLSNLINGNTITGYGINMFK